MGQRGMKNCPSCRGRTTVQCKACSKGRIECPTCAGVGRVRAWLEVESTINVEIKVHPPIGITALHRGLHAAEDLDRDPGTYRIPRVHDSGWVDRLSGSLPFELQATLDPVADRIIGQREQAFQSDVFHLTYATRRSFGVVDVSGDPPGILPGSNWWPLRRRLLLAMFAGIVMFMAAALFHGAYVGRTAWFHEHGNSGPIAVLGLLAAIVTSVLVAHSWLPQPARRSIRIKVKTAVIGAAWLAMVILWFTGGPSIEGIQASLAQGDLPAARHEADAIQAIHASPDGIEEPLRLLTQREEEAESARRHADDEQHLEHVTRAQTLASAVESLAARWWSEDFASQARAAVLARASTEVEQHFQAGSSAGLIEVAALVEAIDAATAARARALSALARASECLVLADFDCTIAALDAWKQQPLSDPPATAAYETTREKTRAELHQWLVRASFKQADLAERKLALELAVANAQLYHGAFGKPPTPVQGLRAQLARTEQQIEKERQRAALLEQRRKAAEEREARRQAAEERRQQRRYAPLLCNDGSHSPSCTCGGSWQGCCSHHGGVAGCSE
jgi:hypothetical protein